MYVSQEDNLINGLLDSVNSLQEIKNDLTILDIDDAQKVLKKLQFLIRNVKKSSANIFETTI